MLVGLVVILMVYGMVKKTITFVWWEGLLLLFAFCGIWLFWLSILPLWAAVLTACLVTMLPYFWPRTIWHNLSFLVGCMGVGLFVALKFPFVVLVLVSVGIVIYEYLRQGQHLTASLVSEAYKAGLPPGLLLPSAPAKWFGKIEDVWQAGKGTVVGLLPFIVFSAISLRVIRHGWLWFAAFAILVIVTGLIWGRGKDNGLKSWFFLAVGVAFYALTGLL